MVYDPHADINEQDKNGNTAIHLASKTGKSQVLNYFLV